MIVEIDGSKVRLYSNMSFKSITALEMGSNDEKDTFHDIVSGMQDYIKQETGRMTDIIMTTDYCFIFEDIKDDKVSIKLYPDSLCDVFRQMGFAMDVIYETEQKSEKAGYVCDVWGIADAGVVVPVYGDSESPLFEYESEALAWGCDILIKHLTEMYSQENYGDEINGETTGGEKGAD